MMECWNNGVEMKKHILFNLVLLFLLSSLSAASQEIGSLNRAGVKKLGLDDLISLCLQQNLDIKTAAVKISSQLERVRQAKGQKLPGVIFSGVYSHIGVVPRFEIPGMADVEFVNPEMLNFSLALDYTLFDWGICRDQVKIEEFGLQSEKLKTLLLKKSFILQLSVLYFNILQVEENAAVIDENIIILEEILDLLAKQFAAGLIPEHQLLQTQVSLEALKAQRVEMKKIKEEMMVTLKNISGLPLEQKILLKKEEKSGDFSPEDMAVMVGTACQEREDFELLNLQSHILEKTQGIIAKSRLPLVSANLNAELRNGIMPDVDRLRINWNVGLSVIYNIFDGNAARFEQQALDHDIQGIRYTLEKLKQNVQANLEKLLSNLKMIEDRMKIEQRRSQIAAKSLHLARQSFKESQATYLEVLNAQSNYNLSESSLIALRYQEFVNLLQIEFEMHSLAYFVSKEEK